MHYHVVLRDGSPVHARRGEMFEMLEEAESAAQLLSERHIQPSWVPTRYPGRAARLHEVAVFLDRRAYSRREVSVLRCEGGEFAGRRACWVNRHGDAMLPLGFFDIRNAQRRVEE